MRKLPLMPAPVSARRRRLTARRAIAIMAVGIFFAAAASAYFFFPSAAKRALADAAAVVAQSWDDTFGTENGGYRTVEITLAGENASSAADMSDAAGVTEGIGEDTSDPATATAPIIVDTSASTTDVASASDMMAEEGDIPAVDEPPVSASSPAGTPIVLSAASTSVARGDSSPPQPPPAQTQPCSVGTAFIAAVAPTYHVVINEIAWMGSVPLAGETASKAANREWIELRNMTDAAVDISGWQIEDQAGKLEIVLRGGAQESVSASAAAVRIPPRGLYLLERSGGPAASGTLPGIAADEGYSGALANGGGKLVLFDAACRVVDRLDASSSWPAGDNGTKQTMERNADGYGWHTSVPVGGTPKAENSIAPPAQSAGVAVNKAAAANSDGENAVANAPAASTTATTTCPAPAAATTTAATTASSTGTISAPVASLVVAEVQVAGEGGSDEDFVKIFNPAAEAVDISGWRLRKRSKSGAEYSLRVFPDRVAIAPGGYVAWGNSADGFGGAIGADVTSTATLAADNSVALFDASGTLMDAVAWGVGTDQYVEGAPYPTNPAAGQVLKRKFLSGEIVDTDNNTHDFEL